MSEPGERQQIRVSGTAIDALSEVWASDPPTPDNDLGLLVRELREANAYTQAVLAAIATFLQKVLVMPASGGTPSLQVALGAWGGTAVTPGASVTITGNLTGSQSTNLAQVNATAITQVGASAAPAMGTSAALEVAQSQNYPLPVVPMHLYHPQAITV